MQLAGCRGWLRVAVAAAVILLAFSQVELRRGTRSVEASGTWTTTGSLAIARTSHTATLLPNGQILVVGGSRAIASPWSLGCLESENAVEGRSVPAPGWLTEDRQGRSRPRRHCSGRFDHGRIDVKQAGEQEDAYALLGGSVTTGLLGLAEVYDPSSGTWTSNGSLATARIGHTATLLPNEQVLVAGGSGRNRLGPALVSLASAELYDASTLSRVHLVYLPIIARSSAPGW